MKEKLLLAFFVSFLFLVSCNNEKDGLSILGEEGGRKDGYDNARMDGGYIIGRGEYIKNQIPFLKTDITKGEYYRIFEYDGELRAIICKSIVVEPTPDEDGEPRGDTEIQLYILQNGEWQPSTKWATGCLGGFTQFCYDSYGDIYVYYNDDEMREGSKDGSKIFWLKDDGSIEIITLEDADILNAKSTYMDEEGKEREFSPNVCSVYMTEKNEVALTYMIPEKNPQIILYNICTGKRIHATDFLGSDMNKFVIRNDKLICYSTPISSGVAPTLDISGIKTGERYSRTYFGEDWDTWDGMEYYRLLICLGKEENVYMCTKNGIYAGDASQKQPKLDLIKSRGELGMKENDYISFFCVGMEDDFYLLYGTDYEEMGLYHFTLS